MEYRRESNRRGWCPVPAHLFRLRPDCCPGGVGMHHCADFRKVFIKFKMRGCVRGRFVAAFHYIAVHINHNHTFWLHLRVVNPAWLNDNQPLFTINGAGIAPGQDDEPMLHKVKIGQADLIFLNFSNMLFSLITRNMHRMPV
jgi:hypothetical protein